MPHSYRHHLSLGLAQALLAGPRSADGCVERLCAALGERTPALMTLTWSILEVPSARWARFDVESLAAHLRSAPAFDDLFAQGPVAPRLRRYLLRTPALRPPPLGLHQGGWPDAPTPGDLAAWLGVDAIELDWLAACPARRRKTGLQHQHYRFLMLPKARGGHRLLEAPKRRLKAIQRQLLDGLLSHVPVHEAAYGFVTGRSVREHAAHHAGQAVVLRFDLRDFFGSVRAARVHALFETLGYPRAAARVLTSLCCCRTPEPVLQRLREEGALDWAASQRLRDAHLPQGAPTSPALANLCCFRLDLQLDALAYSLGARYTRYADDIVVSGPSHLAARSAQICATVGAAAAEHGFALNHRKTRVQSQAVAQRVCGVVVNVHPNPPRDEFDLLKAILHRCARFGPDAENREQVADWRAHLRGRVAWMNQINPARGAKLASLFERIAWPQGQ